MNGEPVEPIIANAVWSEPAGKLGLWQGGPSNVLKFYSYNMKYTLFNHKMLEEKQEVKV